MDIGNSAMVLMVRWLMMEGIEDVQMWLELESEEDFAELKIDMQSPSVFGLVDWCPLDSIHSVVGCSISGDLVIAI